MEVDCDKIRWNIQRLRDELHCSNVDRFLRLSKFTSTDMDELVTFLGELLEDPTYTTAIGTGFGDILLLIVANVFPCNNPAIVPAKNEQYIRKCVALSKLVGLNPSVLRFSVQYFRNNPAPFSQEENYTPKKKVKKSIHAPVSELDIIQCCYRFLVADPNYFRRAWNWSEFLQLYKSASSSQCSRQRFYFNRILALISCMTQSELSQLDREIQMEVEIEEQMRTGDSWVDTEKKPESGEKNRIWWNFRSDVVVNVGDVLLPIFDSSNCEYYRNQEKMNDELVIVDSTRINVRSLALGVSSGKAICLSGPVGCGKTSLVEHLACKTGRIAPKTRDTECPVNTVLKEKARKRKANGKEEQMNKLSIDQAALEKLKTSTPKNGFLRIQLGDQTDSKMLLGHYRCTDTPGEFVWQPGVLTQAVMNGYWLLLEDLDSATQDVCTVLTNLLENNYLSVPGFRDCLQIEPGFQLFLTLRTNKSGTSSAHNVYTLLEKYLYTINLLSLSRPELCSIICTNFPKLKPVASRIVDIYLTFSSGCHAITNDRIDESISILTNSDNGKTNGLETDGDDHLPRFQYDHISLTSIPSSGRLVSTRDLIKLCRRSNPTFSVTSSECAYFVFQNAVDIFCSHLPAGEARRNLIVSIGGKIGISKSRCEHICDEYKPDLDVSSSKDIKIGRVVLDRGRTKQEIENDENDYDFSHKKLRLDKNSCSKVQTQDFKLQSKAPTFSFTRPASCLLERIAVSVSQQEPILLVGETGVGKTSAIQYLAYQTHHKLVVVNMNNQSDVSDLIGGFKPIDLSYVITPLRYEFEFLFNRTFNAQKNEKFLSNISICYNRAEFNVLVKLMLKIIEKVFQRKEDEQLRLEKIYEKWTVLQQKLQKLDQQLKNSVNVSFAFIPGSLVNCIRNGDWVLLDEINLASTETLECLSTILEPDGSIVLLERGDFVPVRRHPDFRIFSCMNPNTDVGKKDLPVGIRNRFTEFFVDELTAENDLLILVNDYLSSSGIQKVRILNTVKLYRRLRSLSQLELNDGLGNKPVFSLRTLCRALSICAKNLCGSIERNLYEAFCLSFLTQLDLKSHRTVLTFIQRTLLNDVNQAIAQQIPRPSEGEQLNFEGYWIEQGPKDVQQCENYILTESVRNNLRDLARIVSIGKLPVLLQGPTSAGKTSLIEYIAKRSGNVCMRINNHEHTDLQEYIGTYVADLTGKLVFKEGVLVEAMRNGHWIILDELNLAPSDILEALNRVLDDNRELFIPETQMVVKAHPNFMLFATQNPPGLYGGRKQLSRAFKNRFIELHFSEIPRAELEIILEKRCLIPKSYSQKMVKVMSELQANRRSTAKQNFTLRDLFRWGNRYTFANKSLLEDSSYDWNQHLIDEGYLVLSSKVRSLYETNIIQDALYTHFRKRISEDNLFTLKGKETSMVTKPILEQLLKQTAHGNIVWTFDMRRMAVLVAKALEFNEPVLLVGPTGCGKTTICQILSSVRGTTLRILNCHMHTEGADFLGGLRPFRKSDVPDEQQSSNQLFEWSDGPLVLSMQEGGFFLADEISLAEDSVLERLNCVLEPERTLLLAEKGGVSTEGSEFVITATEGFQFLATMNPGGDFGKKELSPALRNRLTEIWCRPTDSKEDLIRIAEHSLRQGLGKQHNVSKLAQVIIDVVFLLKSKVDKLNFSIRDVLAWVTFICKNSSNISLAESLIYGLETVFLDALELLPYETLDEIVVLRKDILSALKLLIKTHLAIDNYSLSKGTSVEFSKDKFGIVPFYIETNSKRRSQKTEFMFSAPTTQNNLFRLLSALSLDKAILLEGPPGVGKTSLVENLAKATGYDIVRINLCEHTDLADLFGTDLPADEQFLEEKESPNSQLGSFVWRDGPLLAALKAKNTWILLDELNLAPQSVLEGLNAILDHRGEVYIAELNKTFKLGQQTRIFAAQNPLRQGGGRKGLPQSFLNRFTKVYLRKLERSDLLHVVNGKYNQQFERLGRELIQDLGRKFGKDISYFEALGSSEDASIKFDLAENMVKFSEHLEQGIANLEFGYKGGPFEANLRDILRWCDLLFNEQTGFLRKRYSSFDESYTSFVQVLFEKMKLVYYQRMRADLDKNYILTLFSKVFSCDAFELEQISNDVGFYWTDDKLYLADLVLDKANTCSKLNPLKTHQNFPILLQCQVESLKNLIECVQLEKPVILCGPSDCGKTKLIHLMTTLTNRFCNVDTIDDSVTGSFQQFDFNRHLEEVSSLVETVVMNGVKTMTLDGTWNISMIRLLAVWEKYVLLNEGKTAFAASNLQSEEIVLFRKRLEALQNVVAVLHKQPDIATKDETNLRTISTVLAVLSKMSQQVEILNTGGHFEWVDSKIVKSLKHGQYICLEHVNLCSSAILDRLNPVFEPDGALLISEKGVDSSSESELIRKHSGFRAFLTLDPKNGEISRAMRNRCVELAFHKEPYGLDDLRLLIFNAGVKDVWIMNTILAIHSAVKKISEFNQFGVAHIVKLAYLVNQNLQMGVTAAKSLTISALEAYVRSSNVDLTGFGIEFYRNALLSAIKEEIDKSFKIPNLVDFENVVLKSNNLTGLQLIKLQAEPLLCILRCHLSGFEDQNKALSGISYLFEEKAVITLENIKYLMYLLYEICTFEDASKRQMYLRKSLQNFSDSNTGPISVMLQDLLNLNDALCDTVTKFSNEKDSLPWNRTMFPRIRDYPNDCDLLQHCLSASLLLQTVLKPIEVGNVTKLSKIDLLAYSKAVSMQLITDTVGNALVTQLYGFLSEFKSQVETALKMKNILDESTYTKLIGSYLWINRMIDLSRKNLFVSKEINSKLIDYVTLHFQWIRKHCLSLLANTISFRDLNETLGQSLKSVTHPLTPFRKIYAKKFTNFNPFYTEIQIQHHQLREEFNELIRLIPTLLGLYDYEEFIRRVNLLNHPKIQDLIRAQVAALGKSSSFQIETTTPLTCFERPECRNLLSLIQSFKEHEQNNENVDLHRASEQLTHMYKVSNELEIPEENAYAPYKFALEMFPVQEYFLLKLIFGKSGPNYDFIANTRSLNINVLELLNNLNTIEYKKFIEMSDVLYDLVLSDHNLLNNLPQGFYRSLSTHQHLLNKKLLNFQMQSLAINSNVCYHNETESSYKQHEEQLSNQSIHGAVLTNNCLSILLTPSGEIRSTGLGELPVWRRTLQQLREAIWFNAGIQQKRFDQQSSGLNKAVQQARVLLLEISTIQDAMQCSTEKAVTDFVRLTSELRTTVDDCKQFFSEHSYDDLCSSANRNRQWRFGALIQSLCGAIRLNLQIHTPLLDPVEKNKLKKEYNNEDIQYYSTLNQAYEYMSITMNYKRLGKQPRDLINGHLHNLNTKQQKLCRKVALRPVENNYTELAKDVSNFLTSCCYPGTVLELIRNANECLDFEVDTKNPVKNCTQSKHFQMRINETIKQIELWINISDKFEHHTLKRYAAYYQDVLEPTRCSIAIFRYGLCNLKHCLLSKRDSIAIKSNGVFYDLTERDALPKILEKFVQFPVVKSLELFDEESSGHKVNIFSLFEKIEHGESNYFRLLKAKLQDVKNSITLQGAIDEQDFTDIDKIVNICNQVWQKQEHQRRKKQAEDDSLYQTKNHCEEEDQEVIDKREIGDMFPNYVDEDFADFIQNDTLEQVIKIDKVKRNQKFAETITNEDYTLICESFIYLMNRFSKSYYYNPETVANQVDIIPVDYVTPFQTKVSIFAQIMQKFKTVINSRMDESIYPGLSFLIGLIQNRYDCLDLKREVTGKYNFYKDSNIAEVVQCVEVLQKVEKRTRELLQEWPDHAVLKDIIGILNRIYALPSTAPIVRFSTGLQLLRAKMDEWNVVAHRLNNLRELEADIVEFVHRWMRMELQFWRECISQTHDNVRSKAYRYWFFMYNLMHEYLQSDSKAKLGHLLDYRKVERRFGEEEMLEEEETPEEGTVKIEDLIHVLKQFMESSNYAEFTTRLRIFKAFEQYLLLLNYENNKKRDSLVAILFNLHLYYDQFSAEIEEFIRDKRGPIEKKLKEFVKIESFNKDLSYFSMRNNIARVHRHLHKFLKEFETELKEKVLPVFTPKNPSTEIASADEQKIKNLRSEPKVTYYMVDVKNFMASLKLKEKYTVSNVPLASASGQDLLTKIDRYFITSRNVVKDAILHAPYPGLIYNLDTFVHEQIETIEYLRGLEVDRSLPKPKQKSQAKQILNQKRKALADFYKSLTQLGLSYRSGIVQNSIDNDFVDLAIHPFSVDLLTSTNKYRKVDQHIVFLNDKLNLHYSKCVFKIKMLLKVMLQPNPDVGLINIDRIKGFAVDMFLLVQNQRKELGKSILSIGKLRDQIVDLTQLNECLESKVRTFEFEHSRRKLRMVRKCVIKTAEVLTQFSLLIKCSPLETRKELQVLREEKGLSQKELETTSQLVQEGLQMATKLVGDMKVTDNYIPGDFIKTVAVEFRVLQELLNKICDQLKIQNGEEYNVYARPLLDLLKLIRECSRDSRNTTITAHDFDEESMNNELENIIHLILIAMQQIYKKYSDVQNSNQQSDEAVTAQNDKEESANETESSLEDRHIKEKIDSDLVHDLKTLNVTKVVEKLGNLFEILENTHDSNSCASLLHRLTRLIPILEQFNLLVEYYLIQQLGAHKICTRMLSVMLTVFIELGTKGFCVPKDIMDDEQEQGGEQQEGNQEGSKFGFEDGEGEKDVSNKIESEDQLEDAKKPDQDENKEEEEKDNKEEKGIDMSEDFDSKLQDVDKPEDEESDEEKNDENEDIDKQMGETEEGAEKLDDQIWGDDEEKEQDEKENDMEEEDGKGSGESDDTHNNLDSEKDKAPGEEDEGLDAIDQAKDERRKEKPKDIEDMNNQEGEEDQENPHHNELEEPPQPDDLDLDEEFNLDKENRPDNETNEEDKENQENPFDIDNMKDGVDDQNEENDEDKTLESEEKKQEENQDLSDEEETNPEGGEKLDEDNQNEDETEPQDEESTQIPDEIKEQEQAAEQEEGEKKPPNYEKHQESKDKRSEEDKIEAMLETQNKGTSDQVANEKPESKQENELDEQDTGEDKEGVGQAENEKSDSGHQGIAESKETRAKEDMNKQKQKQERRRQGNTDEDRTLGDPEDAEKKRLKTLDEINRKESTVEDPEEEKQSEEYQHVKDAKSSDKTTLDNATEEQSKKVQHKDQNEESENPEDEPENAEELMDVDETKEELEAANTELQESEKTEQKKNKASKKDEDQQEKVESLENVEVEGETVQTSDVPRGAETTAHTSMDILSDLSVPEEPTTAEALELRKLVEKESTAVNSVQPAHEDFDQWQHISNKMLPNARELCEQLRLILEPTKCTRLKGDYRTGRRINMKKIIPYIASQFRKDKIWLRRTKAAQRDYKITIAIDDSKSMDHNNSKDLTLQAISLVSQALTLLESGRLNVMSFGESPRILLKHSEQFDGAKLMSSLNFEQNQSRIADLLDFIRTFNSEDAASSDNGIFENLLLIISDGRNIFSEGEKKVKNSVKLARLQRIFIVYVIIDNPENKHSIMDIRVPLFTADRNEIVMQSYLDVFPFPYYVIVRDLGQLPLVLSDAMRQWFELVNGEQ
ncbi:midasin [Uranotaenia lowii]|uniref:midasin n=1 Tax=Uranotaenia lowii TaxID=190385 RepID=UPI00247A646C|nr:midasin [Uranotaenia lowii]